MEINNYYVVGIYIRLSREDDDKIYESESITNQKCLLLQYAKENNLNVFDIYVDDGFSGTNFNRPGFNRLIRDIEDNKINMVITKDLSRLGRDYIGTGELLEKYFPMHNVRYIAITDNIDTYLDNSNSDIAPFKAIMNDYYARDISKKIRSSLRAKMKDGKYVSGRAPFGYKIDSNNKNHLVINDTQALIVKKIFDMALSGMSCFKIAKELTNEGIMTPSEYYSFSWNDNYCFHINKWNSKTIKDILTNRVYVGDLVQNKRNKVNYKVNKIVYNSPDDYIIVENTHDAIIDKDLFNNVGKLIRKNVGRIEKKENHLLDGLLYCGDCGHRISVQARRKIDNRCYTICNYYRTYMKERLCTTHSNNYDVLEQVIIEKLKEICFMYIDKDMIKRSVLNKIHKLYFYDNKKKLDVLESDMNLIKDNLDNIYIDKLNKKISYEQYDRIRNKLEIEFNKKKKLYDELNNSIISNNNYRLIIDNYIDMFLSLEDFNRDLVINLVDRIEIFDDKCIVLRLAFGDYK